MSTYFGDKTTLYVSNDETAEEADVNLFVDRTDSAFTLVETDVAALQTLTDSLVPLAAAWAAGDQGVLYTGQTDYSSKAYAEESKGWVNAGYAGEPSYTEADGSTTIVKGAKQYATEASDDADMAEDWANYTGGPVPGGGGEYSAKHYAESAITTNTISQGDAIRIDQTGVGPYDFEVNHEDTSSMSDINNSSTTVLQDATVDDYGHMTAMGSVQLTGYFNLASGTNTWSGSNTFSSTLYCTSPSLSEDSTRVATTAFVKDAYPGHAVGYASWSPTVGGLYTNTVGRPVIVAGTLDSKYANQIRIDGVDIMETDGAGAGYVPFMIVVPEGSTYGINGSASGLISCFRML